MGALSPIVWGSKSNEAKINYIKYIVAFGGLQAIIQHTTTIQK